MTNLSPSSSTSSIGNKIRDDTYHAGVSEVILFGLGIVLGGSSCWWNDGLKGGYGTFITAISIISTGYCCLALCLAELTSITAFAGGAYAYGRAALGPMYGFFFGCFELGKNAIFALVCVDMMAGAITHVLRLSHEYGLLIDLGAYLVLASLLLRGGGYFWLSISSLATASIVLVLVYILGALANANSLYAGTLMDRPRHGFHNGMSEFMDDLLYPVWFFIGIESITVAGARMGNGPAVIPKALLGSVAIMTVLAFVLPTLLYFGFPYRSEPFAEVYSDDLALVQGYHDNLYIPSTVGHLLAIPPLLGSSLGFLYCSINVFHAMTLSGLFNPIFRPVVGAAKVPARVLVLVVFVQYLICILIHYVEIVDSLFPFCLLGACGSYLGILSSFLVFRRSFSSMERGLSIPYGEVFAVVGIVVFLLLLLGLLVFEDHIVVTLPLYFGFCLLAGVYYVLVAEKRQFFSAEEQEKFFKAYILNANAKKKTRKKLSGTRSSGVLGSLLSLMTGSSTGLGSSPRSMNSQLSVASRFSIGSNNRVGPAPAAVAAVSVPSVAPPVPLLLEAEMLGASAAMSAEKEADIRAAE